MTAPRRLDRALVQALRDGSLEEHERQWLANRLDAAVTKPATAVVALGWNVQGRNSWLGESSRSTDQVSRPLRRKNDFCRLNRLRDESARDPTVDSQKRQSDPNG